VVVAGRSVCLNGGCSKQHDVGVCVPKHGLEQREGVEPSPPYRGGTPVPLLTPWRVDSPAVPGWPVSWRCSQ
jgi:hypothetical protein